MTRTLLGIGLAALFAMPAAARDNNWHALDLGFETGIKLGFLLPQGNQITHMGEYQIGVDFSAGPTLRFADGYGGLLTATAGLLMGGTDDPRIKKDLGHGTTLSLIYGKGTYYLPMPGALFDLVRPYGIVGYGMSLKSPNYDPNINSVLFGGGIELFPSAISRFRIEAQHVPGALTMILFQMPFGG